MVQQKKRDVIFIITSLLSKESENFQATRIVMILSLSVVLN